MLLDLSFRAPSCSLLTTDLEPFQQPNVDFNAMRDTGAKKAQDMQAAVAAAIKVRVSCGWLASGRLNVSVLDRGYACSTSERTSSVLSAPY